jgi:hypothetical protein
MQAYSECLHNICVTAYELVWPNLNSNMHSIKALVAKIVIERISLAKNLAIYLSE